jgi:hypothetical protein
MPKSSKPNDPHTTNLQISQVGSGSTTPIIASDPQNIPKCEIPHNYKEVALVDTPTLDILDKAAILEISNWLEEK